MVDGIKGFLFFLRGTACFVSVGFLRLLCFFLLSLGVKHVKKTNEGIKCNTSPIQ